MSEDHAPAWRIGIEIPAATLPAVEAALDELGGALTLEAVEDGHSVLVELYLAEKPDRRQLTACLAAASLATGADLPTPRIEPLAATDWVAESQAALPALRIGPFHIHGNHVDTPPPEDSIPIQIEASFAFGTGRHESTKGCLWSLAELRATHQIASALDMGCGSGILAIAIAKLWSAPVIAIDWDPKAVALARDNVARNGVADLVHVHVGDGFDCAGIPTGAQYDLIVENILAEPICSLAPGLMQHLAPGGVAVLSGLLADEQDAIRAAHASFRLLQRFQLNNWVSLVLKR